MSNSLTYAKVVLASVGPCNVPIYSIEARYPRFIHSEVMTHRDRARNAASSRAIPWMRKSNTQLTLSAIHELGGMPIGKGPLGLLSLDSAETYEYYVKNCMYTMIMTQPVVPISFGQEQKGMQSGDELTGSALRDAELIWLEARNNAVRSADMLSKLGVHKSICNRLTEPFMYITVLMTATEWKNFFRLRCHPDAEKHISHLAVLIQKAIEGSSVEYLPNGSWHMPYLSAVEKYAARLCDSSISMLPEVEQWKQISAGRCARLSYLNQDGVRSLDDDVRLCKSLMDNLHVSPLEHVAQATDNAAYRSGPFRGWHQMRKDLALENVEG